MTVEDLAYKIFNSGYRTVCRDLKYFRSQGTIIPVRSQQKDIGRTLTHRVKAVELYLQRKPLTQIAQKMNHSLDAIKNYISTFARVVFLTQEAIRYQKYLCK